MSADRIRTLDGIRGVAILLVVAGHATQNLAGIPDEVRRWLVAFANPGAGVRLFFVLSGYLITMLLVNEQTTTGSISLGQFYWRRMLRIFPAFYCFLAALLVIELWRPAGHTVASFLTAGSFTWNYGFLWLRIPGDASWSTGHLWTLALEQQFYLLWPVLLVLLGRKKALWIAVALVFWCPFARVGSYLLFPDVRGYLGMMLHTGVDSIMMGCAAAILVQSPEFRNWIRENHGNLLRASLAWLLVISPVLTTLIRGSSIAFGFSGEAVAASALILALHHGPANAAGGVFARGVLPALGLISYSLYLWQQLFLSSERLTSPVALTLGLCGAVITATLSYIVIEKPPLRLKRSPILVPQPARVS